jgi:anaerobic magnesium-protoporphyrin IX monomethyl ester cyclase
MLAEGRCHGDYMQWDYRLSSPEVERIFDLSMQCFHVRNFGEDALANRIMATRFDVEVCRHFHPDVFQPSWHARGKALSAALSVDSADALAAIVDHVKLRPQAADPRLVESLTTALRAKEHEIAAGARALATELMQCIGQGRPLTELGDRVATPLQTARLAARVPS